jgi:putative salt-induced outer membrane protein
MTLTHLASASALALLVAAPAFAQGGLVGTEALDDRIEEIEEDVQDEFEEGDDPYRFGPAQFAPGLAGSMSLAYSGTTGNSENQDLSVVGRLRYGGDVVNQSLGFGLEFSEGTDPETDESFTTEEELFVVYDASRELTERLYGFGIGLYRNDDFDTLQQDAFVGAGLGYRIVNTPRFAWRVQAGPGVRWTEDQLGEEETELAGIAASRFFYALSDTVSVSNGTEVLYSDEAGTLVRNDLGANFTVSEQLTTRVSYLTDYNSDALPGLDSTDNRLGVALVFGF